MNKKSWSETEINMLKTFYPTATKHWLATALGRSTVAIKTRAQLLGLKKEVREYGGKFAWTAEQDFILKDKYEQLNAAEIATLVNKSHYAVKNRLHKLGITLSKEVKLKRCNNYQKGMVAYNTGKKQHEYMSAEAIEKTKATRFKKGSLPHNALPDGTIVNRKDNKGRLYQMIKLPNNRKLKYMHVHLWQQHHGAIPKGHIILFSNKNSMDCRIENLECISKAENMRRNSIQNFPEEIIQAITLISKLNKKIKHHEKQN
jgi:hypothetical protein